TPRDLHSFPTRRSSDLARSSARSPSPAPSSPHAPDASSAQFTPPAMLPLGSHRPPGAASSVSNSTSSSEASIDKTLLRSGTMRRSEEHTSELQSRGHLV